MSNLPTGGFVSFDEISFENIVHRGDYVVPKKIIENLKNHLTDNKGVSDLKQLSFLPLKRINEL